MSQFRRRAARGRSREQCARRGQPAQRGEVARAEDRGRQGRVGAECAEARHARPEASRAAGRGCRRVRRARGGYGRGAGSRRRAPVRAGPARRGRAWRLARADRIEPPQLFEGAGPTSGSLGLFVARRMANGGRPRPVRDGNGPRSFETVRGSQCRPWWSVRSDQPLSKRSNGRVLARPAHPQGAPGRAGDRVESAEQTGRSAPRGHSTRRRGRPRRTNRAAAGPTNLFTEPPDTNALHEPAAPWRPNEPEPARDRQEASGAVLASTGRVTAVFERTRRAR